MRLTAAKRFARLHLRTEVMRDYFGRLGLELDV